MLAATTDNMKIQNEILHDRLDTPPADDTIAFTQGTLPQPAVSEIAWKSAYLSTTLGYDVSGSLGLFLCPPA
jgi:hypothetical protein